MGKSSYHIKCLELIKKKWPTLCVIEEYAIKIDKKTYYLDFFLPLIKVAIEVHGSQHYIFCEFFHGTQQGFIEQKKRDRIKREYLEENNIRLIELPYNQVEEWQKILTGQ